MSKKRANPTRDSEGTRRRFTREFKEDAVRMMLNGHSARSVPERLGLSGTNVLYRWKKIFLEGKVVLPLTSSRVFANWKWNRVGSNESATS